MSELDDSIAMQANLLAMKWWADNEKSVEEMGAFAEGYKVGFMRAWKQWTDELESRRAGRADDGGVGE